MAHKKTSYSASERKAADAATRGSAKAAAIAESADATPAEDEGCVAYGAMTCPCVELEPNYSDDPEGDLLEFEAPGYAIGGE